MCVEILILFIIGREKKEKKISLKMIDYEYSCSANMFFEMIVKYEKRKRRGKI